MPVRVTVRGPVNLSSAEKGDARRSIPPRTASRTLLGTCASPILRMCKTSPKSCAAVLLNTRGPGWKLRADARVLPAFRLSDQPLNQREQVVNAGPQNQQVA